MAREGNFQRRADTFPRGALIGAGGLVLFSLAAAMLGRIEGPVTTVPASVATAARDLRFEDRGDGAVVVTSARDGQVVEVVTGESGFLRGTLRGLARARRQAGVGQEAPFRLTAWADGRLTLDDAATDRHIDLEAFGSTNTAVFAQLLTASITKSGSVTR